MCKRKLYWASLMLCLLAYMSCGDGSKKDSTSLNETGDDVENGIYSDDSGNGYTNVEEQVIEEYGNRVIRIESDETISMPEKMKDRNNCFIVMSKKDYYLYVYEAQGNDTVLLARYDCCFSRLKGQKEKSGDMKTPHCTIDNPFSISQIVDASTWAHDFGDGRGEILAYGAYFHRLVTPGHTGIGIHGSTNNAESVPGRASEGCIRLRDNDIIDLHDNYTFVGMKVFIKAEDVDDYPFEKTAMERQSISRKRHLDPSKILSNSDIANEPIASRQVLTEEDTDDDYAYDEPATSPDSRNGDFIRENMTIEELNAKKTNKKQQS